MTLTQKIARLVVECGWNQEEFARKAGVHRHTARQILHNPKKQLHNATVRQCADALGVAVHQLRDEPLERLLQRLKEDAAAGQGGSDQPLTHRQRIEMATQPELKHWLERHPKKAKAFSHEELDELLSLQGTGGPLTEHGVEYFVKLIERKREMTRQMEVIAGTEFIDVLEELVRVLYEKVQVVGGSDDTDSKAGGSIHDSVRGLGDGSCA